MLTKHHDKILCLLANDFGISELLKNGIDYVKENYLILKLSGIDKPVEGDLKFYIGADKLNDIFIDSAEYGHLEIVKYLVSQGADIHAWNNWALRGSASNGKLKVVKYLASQGANIHVNDDQVLQYSANNGHLEIVKYLVSQGASIHINNDQALRWGAYNGHLKVVKYLVSQGADIHAKDDQALRWSAKNGHLEIVQYLTQEKQNTNQTTRSSDEL